MKEEIYYFGILGLTSTLLGSVRGCIFNKSTTICPMSSGCIFHDSSPLPELPNSVATEPGMIVDTFMPWLLKSSIAACVKPTSPNLLALYALAPAKKLVPARLAIVMMYPFDFFNSERQALML